jgi:DTW domain-containing protein YfiP
MHDLEPLRPSNTGWLVADVVPDTAAFAWSRTAPDPRLLARLRDPSWQPYVVFPADGGDEARAVREVAPAPGRRPLFVLLDGTWAETRKMFRRSPYLDAFPLLDLPPGRPARGRLRRSRDAAHVCTAEAAARCLALAGETAAAAALEGWLDAYVGATLRNRSQN